MDAIRLLRRAGLAVLDLVVPPQCPTCDRIVPMQGGFCAACFEMLTFLAEPCCDRCGSQLDRRRVTPFCDSCIEDPPIFSRARAALAYDAASRQLILPLKNANRLELAGTLAPHMARIGAALLSQADILVPVPLHVRRLRARGYNQSVLLARAILRGRGREGPVLIPDAMLRLTHTPPLGDLSASERARTVANIFAIRPSRAQAIAGARVLLIDDVLTSGATANACARTLREAGARDVSVLVAARVADPRAEWQPST